MCNITHTYTHLLAFKSLTWYLICEISEQITLQSHTFYRKTNMFNHEILKQIFGEKYSLKVLFSYLILFKTIFFTNDQLIKKKVWNSRILLRVLWDHGISTKVTFWIREVYECTIWKILSASSNINPNIAYIHYIMINSFIILFCLMFYHKNFQNEPSMPL